MLGVRTDGLAVFYRNNQHSPKEAQMATFAERLTGRRNERGLTQRELCALTGIDQSQYARYEKGTIPNEANIKAIAVALECTADYLLGLTDDPGVNREFEALPEDEKNMLIIFRAYKRGKHIPRAAMRYLRDLNLLDEGDTPSVEGPKQTNISSE